MSLTGCVGYPVYGGEVYGGSVYGKGYGYPSYYDDSWYYGSTYPYTYRPYGSSSYNYYNYYGTPYLFSRPAPSYYYGWNDNRHDDHRKPPGHVYRPGPGNGDHDHDHDHDGGQGRPRPPANRPPQNGGWADIAKPIIKNPPGRSSASPGRPSPERRDDNDAPGRQAPGRVIRERAPEPALSVAPKPKTERPQREERQQRRAEREDDGGRQRQR